MSQDEERGLEVEALQCIYADDFALISSTPHHFTIRITTPQTRHLPGAAFTLDVTFTPNYPNELPVFLTKAENNLTSDDIAQMKPIIVEEANKNLGNQMVYAVAQRLKEWIDDKRAKYVPPAKPVVVETKHIGTAVTPQTFTKWWNSFLVRHPEKTLQAICASRVASHQARRSSRRATTTSAASPSSGSGGFTGRQLFERDKSLVGSDTLPDSGASGVDWSLFADEDDDLDDDDGNQS
ncbi:hypothetical protein Pelo_2496 [Pelomyxa schiedti]|nr:hypothetical protein Pelo_2496 [Pelomyxa schiedti]